MDKILSNKRVADPVFLGGGIRLSVKREKIFDAFCARVKEVFFGIEKAGMLVSNRTIYLKGRSRRK